MSVNVLNPIENQVPDLPTIKLDVCPFALHILKKSTAEKLQFVVGCVDGSLRMYTAKPTEEWWKPDTYDDYDEYCSAQAAYRSKRQKLDVEDEEDRDGDEDEEKEELNVVEEDEDDEGLFPGEEEEAVEQFNQEWSVQQSNLSIRAISNIPEMDHLLYTATRDGRLGLLDIERGSLLRDFENIKKCGFEKIEAWDCNLVITGDEQGTVSGYDMRVNNSKPVMEANTKPKKAGGQAVLPAQNNRDFLKHIPQMACTRAWKESDHADYITGMSLGRVCNNVAFTSADKCLSIYSVRTGKFVDISAGEDNELFSCCYMKDDSLLVCGTDVGPLSIYSSGDVAHYRNRLKVHNQSVGLITKLDQDTVLTGCDDGIIRVIMIEPSRVIGVVGVHLDHISAIDTWRNPVSTDETDFIWANDIVGTCSHDYSVRFWRMQDMQIIRRERTTNEIKAMKAAKGEKKAVAKVAENNFDDSDFGDLGEEFKTSKAKKANHDVGVAQAAFSAESFRKKHNSTLSGMYEEDRAHVNAVPTTKPVADRVKPLPELGRQVSKQKKVKHGAKNFFNGI